MAKLMVTAAYTAEGSRKLTKEGGSARRAAVKKLVEGLGGQVDAWYFAYGVHDAVVVVDLPDATAGLALSLAVNGSGAVRSTTTPLIKPEERVAARKKAVSHKAPGA